jgi:hypothetical protein
MQRIIEVVANEIIKVINSHYKSMLTFLNPSYFTGINVLWLQIKDFK